MLHEYIGPVGVEPTIAPTPRVYVTDTLWPDKNFALCTATISSKARNKVLHHSLAN